MIFARAGRGPKTIPRCHAIVAYFPAGNTLFQKLKRGAQAFPKLVRRNCRQLRLGIVHVINVDAREIHIAERLRQLVLEIARRHAMRAARDIGPGSKSGSDEIIFDVSTNITRRRTVEWQITAFGADDQLFARKTTSLRFPERCAN